MSILKLKPSCKDYLWGGHRLAEEYGKEDIGGILAEIWELSCHPDGPSRIENGAYSGKTLQEYIDRQGKEVLGIHCRRFRDFPILIKFIDAKDNLSIQVHPDNGYALQNEGQYGKTEMWYVMDAGENAFLYYGFKREISKEEFAQRIQEDTLLEVLNAVPVQKGDVLFIEAGTIHAIGKDILIAEIQQNSNVTYRVYDYGRVGKDGKKRDLHIEKALAVTNRVPILWDKSSYPHVADCDYFTVDRLSLDGSVMKRMEGFVAEESFASILFLSGKGTISSDEETLSFRKGDSFFIPAGSGSYRIEGICDALITTIRDKAGQVRIGIDIGGTDVKIGLVDVHHKLIASSIIPTQAERPAQELITEIGEQTKALLSRQCIALEQCMGAGVGVPGTVDRKAGTVMYSNNLRWENVPLAEMLGRFLPILIQIANDADCAALGEAVAGTGLGYQNLVMVTLGTGVGGGVIMNHRVVDGSELGHMVIVENGEPCTCGRRGCLEAYASATALVRDAKRATGEDMLPEDIFAAASAGNLALKEVVDTYIRRLGVGIVNMINIFRPQIVLLGGGISQQGNALLDPIWEIVRTSCFGGEKSSLPELAVATLENKAGMIGAAALIYDAFQWNENEP